MKRSFFLGLICAFACCLFMSNSVQAQYAEGISAITYDQYSQQIFTYSATEVDFYTSYYYDAYVEGSIWTTGVIASGTNWDHNEDRIAEVSLQASVQYNHGYHLFSDHFVVGYYEVYEPTWGYYGYWDPYGYDYLPGGTYPGGYTFLPSGQTVTQYGWIFLGTTDVVIWIYPNIGGQIDSLGFKGDHHIHEYSTGDAIDPNDDYPVWFKSPAGSKPTAYTKGTKPTMFVYVTFDQAVPSGTNVTIRAKLGGNIVATKTTSIQGYAPKIDNIPINTDLENPASVKISNYTLEWELTYDGQNWLPLGSSGPHKIYWTYDLPKTNPFQVLNFTAYPQIFDRALEIGCGSANGATQISNISNAINNAVFAQADYNSSQQPFSIHPLLWYTMPGASSRAPASNCAVHASLLAGILKSIGIDATFQYIWGGKQTDNTRYWYSYRHPDPNNLTNIIVEAVTLRSNRLAYSRSGVPLIEANPHFTFHALVKVNNLYYDPSYGLNNTSTDLTETYDGIRNIWNDFPTNKVVRDTWSNGNLPTWTEPECPHSNP